nr:MAG TPA: hypothetical protein [Caudoviricetes sp.]
MPNYSVMSVVLLTCPYLIASANIPALSSVLRSKVLYHSFT